MSNEKQFLAMLAIPVILSMVLSFSEEGTNRVPQSSNPVAQEVGTTLEVDEDAEYTNEKARKKAKQLRASIEAKDFNAFLSASRGTSFGDIMTREAFDELASRYALERSGYKPSSYLDVV